MNQVATLHQALQGQIRLKMTIFNPDVALCPLGLVEGLFSWQQSDAP